MEMVIVILIVFAAAWYVGRIFFRGLKSKEPCSCGCASCSAAGTCTEPTAGRSSDPSSE